MQRYVIDSSVFNKLYLDEPNRDKAPRLFVKAAAAEIMRKSPKFSKKWSFQQPLLGAALEIDACQPSNTEGFRNCRFQNRFRSISLRLASSHTVFQLVSIASRCLSQMAVASSFESWK